MTGSRMRLSLVEYGAPKDLCKEIFEATGLERGIANQMLIEAGARAASGLGVSVNPISIESKGVRAAGVAGLIRLGPSLELEIAPKFLGLDDADANWREDFFFLSTLLRHGRLFASERLTAASGAPRDLSTLVARALTEMYQARKRRPLRAYRRAKEMDFFIDGDPDPVDLLFPGPDGFEQEIVRFDRQNTWNGIISAAARELLPEVSDATAAAGLMRLIEDLAPQSRPNAARWKALPSRHRAWQPLYDLSVDVLKGLGLTYKQGTAYVPGYVVSTWQVWEDLLTLAARIGFGRSAVSSQVELALGTRARLATGPKALNVKPDCVIQPAHSLPRFLLDAKYKGNIERGSLRITEADVYEAMAFAAAARCEHVVLAYPAPPDTPQKPPGTCLAFERIEVPSVRIIGIQVEVRGISRLGALQGFATALSGGISATLSETIGTSHLGAQDRSDLVAVEDKSELSKHVTTQEQTIPQATPMRMAE